MKNFKAFRWFSCILAALIVLFTSVVSAHAAAAKVSDAVPASQTLPENTLLQFRAGGHILGFKPDKVYFASFDHAIIEEFVGTNGVMPAGEAGKGKTEDTKGAPQLGKVIYKDLWKGITLQYESRDGGIAESTYLLEPEAEVKDIRLRYNVPVGIEKDGTLRFRHESDRGYFILSAPKAWQDIKGKRTHIEVAFADYGDNTIGFRLGEYNRQYPVVIDPTYSWHTFYGGVSSGDIGYGIAVDTSGNVYVTGNSTATWNGPGGTVPLNAFSGGNFDIVVLKLNSAGVYQWHTFYGSASSWADHGIGIAVDTSANVYVTGESYGTWDGPGATAPLNAYSGGSDIVVLKLNSAGAYQWHTFYGSSNLAIFESGYGIAVDTSGNVYVTGYGGTWDGPGPTAPLNAFSGSGDIVVLKLNTAGAYQWHTFYGSVGAIDIGQGIAVDTSGNVYVTGRSPATWDGPGPTAPLNAFSGSGDIVVLKLNTAGAYQWHTFYGSVGAIDIGQGIAVDTSGNVYVTGRSEATWNGPGPVAPLNAYSGSVDIVVLKLNTAGAYQWHTFYGSAGFDYGLGIAVDTSSNVYVTGYSVDTWNGPGATPPLNTGSGWYNVFVLKLNTNGAYQWHTFYGDGSNYGRAIAVDNNANMYVTGNSTATWDGPCATAPLNANTGGDIFVLKLAGAFTVTVTSNAGGNGTGTVVSNTGGISYTYQTASTGTTTAINDGTNVVVTSTAGAGSTVSWGGTCTAMCGVEAGNSTTTATCTFASINSNKTATATFTLNTYTVTANATGNGTGTVTSNTGGINYTYQTSNTGTTSAINYGTSVVVTATAGAGSTASWSGTCTTAGGVEAGNGTATATCTFSSLNSNKTATVTFSSTVTVPTMSEWGMIIFMFFAGLSSIYYLRRRRA